LAASPDIRRVSAAQVPQELAPVVVGCAECHGLNPDRHPDSFDHEGEKVHPVVTPKDCAVCHPAEAGQYEKNKMAQAVGILLNNPLYMDMARRTTGAPKVEEGRVHIADITEIDLADACLNCHGTRVKVKGLETRTTEQGNMSFPVLTGWPNQGVGRENPDSSLGSCAACHTRHAFAVKTARQPATCGQCHKGPDVPAYKIWEVSKHGNLYASHKDEWDFEKTPWAPGRDFTAPTCAVCHVSRLVNAEGAILAERTHQMNDRLPRRLFGLPYSHPQPEDADTSKLKNRAGLPLPTDLTGEPAAEGLIDAAEMDRRQKALASVCSACHAQSWVQGHFALLDHSVRLADGSVKAATDLMQRAWASGAAKGPESEGASLFDEPIEKQWVQHWLFFANSVRLAAAMGGADYGVFDGGRWDLARNLAEMAQWLEKNAAKASQP
jgi:cytochrome c553